MSETYGLAPVKNHGLRVRVDTFVAYHIHVILPTIFFCQALRWEIAQLQKAHAPGSTPQPLLTWGPPEAAAHRLLEQDPSCFCIQSWNPVTLTLIVPVPSATESSRQYARTALPSLKFTSRVARYCTHLGAAHLSLQSPALSLMSLTSLLAYPGPSALACFGKSSQPLAEIEATENAELGVPLLEPRQEPFGCKPLAGSAEPNPDHEALGGLAGPNGVHGDWLEDTPKWWGWQEAGVDGVPADEPVEVPPAPEASANDSKDWLVDNNLRFLKSVGISEQTDILKLTAFGAAMVKEKEGLGKWMEGRKRHALWEVNTDGPVNVLRSEVKKKNQRRQEL
ncbi:hypothetical protein BDK51DRAFT_29813 [Blyttiomyces helicus]|uniref:Uncharacterized protein n=1 Tax=Blyttiomyces helicus TaxID=388810 RepID=A0A4V1IQ10_9FUNG|nr:hypothetical protein BDK51DRAFT_29813 [Blyttiomyces helicus]|eukprot:RKO84927.1 hypothetical protein BDK51DRAFT_29813 [Blyttiomyces helicus]